jgi:Domain of Unknown Function (DUF1080)
MRRSLLGPIMLAAVVAVLPTIAEGEQAGDKGWVQLFNGKDLTGWKIHEKPSKAFVEMIKKEKDGKVIGYDGKLEDGKTVKLWEVKDGILIGSGPASHLFSERGDYQNFHYRIEARINDGGNSGQYFRTEFGPNFPKGYEAQINATHKDKIRTGSLYFPKLKEVLILDTAPHKPDEWFTQEVIANGNHLTVIVNGKKTVEWKDPENRHTKGHFALQGHDPGSVVQFKKIEVKELPPSK